MGLFTIGDGIIYLAGANYVRPIIRIIARALFRSGGFGILALSVVDSSPLVVPLGNDLLVLALSARYHERMLYYAVMATLGSVLGCFVTDWIGRKGGARITKFASGKRLGSIEEMVHKRAGWTLVVASLLPPPFPFTAIVAAAAAFNFPRKKLLEFVAGGRLVRFVIEGALAIHYGRWIIRQARSPMLEYGMIALIAISIVASAISIYQWSAKSKRTAEQTA